MTAFIIVFIIFCTVLLIYKTKNQPLLMDSNALSITEILLISSATSFLLYSIFYHFSAYIWSLNLKIPPEQFTSYVRRSQFTYEHDGIEGYVLYTLMFTSIFLSYIFTQLFSRAKNRIIYLSLFFVLAFISSLYFTEISFIPPWNAIGNKHVPLVVLAILLTTGALMLMQKYLHPKLFFIIFIFFLIPSCFISTGTLFMADYSYIWTPALRLLNGAPISEIYFQYDLFLSLLAALWMKLNLDLNLFQILGQFSFFLFFVGIFIFTKKFFINKQLPILLVISLLLIRYYGVDGEPVALFQITPFRLDLWLILLILVYYKGTYHWINAVVIGLLVLVHRNFGLLYLLSYFELLFVLFAVELMDLIITNKINFSSFISCLQKHFSLNYKNFLIIAGFIIVNLILFKGFLPESAVLYQKIGIGMIQISKTSFYWYIPIVYSLCFLLLMKHRNKFSSQYFHTGILIIFIAIGNSIYFFGRSHENNILNISGAIILTLFLLFDLFGQNLLVPETSVKPKTSKKDNKDSGLANIKYKIKKATIAVLPILFISIATYYYSDRISGKIETKFKNFKKSQYIYPLNTLKSNSIDFLPLKKITNNSDKVYFLNYWDDFRYYYYGNYKLIGRNSPYSAWILNDELVKFLQNLLDKNYYLVITDLSRAGDLPKTVELLSQIRYNKVISENGFTAISKDNVESVLMKTAKNPIAHIEIDSDLKNNGIYLSRLDLKENFTIEMLLKSGTEQVSNASIINNAITDSLGNTQGLTIQQNGPNQNQFLFAYGGGGKSWSSPALFKLNANEWNYIVISVKKDAIKIFNNGQVVYSDKLKFTLKNSNSPLVIANGIGYEGAFKGLIKEVKIVNDSISEETILNTFENIKTQIID